MRAIGIDIGGTTLRAGVVDDQGRILALASIATPVQGDPQPLIDALAQIVGEVAQQSPPTVPIAGLGIPGVRAAGSQVLLRAVNLPKLEGLDLQKFFEHGLNRKVRIDSDAVCAGFAQWRAAAFADRAAHAPLPTRFVYLSIGTGVGACVILDGQIVRHTRGGPGHLGHLIVDTSKSAPLCRCGLHGCLEAVVRHFAADAESRANLDLAGLVHGLTTGLVQVNHLYAPEEIRLGGGVIDHHPHIPELCGRDLAMRGGTLGSPTLAIQGATLPTDRAGVIGAALLAMVAQ